jgi:hypothetical protein
MRRGHSLLYCFGTKDAVKVVGWTVVLGGHVERDVLTGDR